MALTGNLDYLIFAVVALMVLGTLQAMVFRGREASLPWMVWLTVISILGAGWFLVQKSDQRERDRLQSIVSGMAPTYAEMLSAMGHAQITLNTPPNSPTYLAMIEAEKQWLKANPAARDIYTMRRLPDGRHVFIVDSETDYDGDGKYDSPREMRTPIGEVYTENDPGLDMAFTGKANFDTDPVQDRWGMWVSSWTPMYDAQGNVEAVLGVDFDAYTWQQRIATARRLRIITLAVLLALVAGSAVAISVLQADITKRKCVEGELRQSEQKLALRAEQTPLAMIEWNRDHGVTDWNAAAERLLGYTKEQAQKMPDLFEKLLPAGVGAEIESRLRGEIPSQPITNRLNTAEGQVIAQDGRSIPCLWFHAPLIGANGHIIGITSLCEDVTERRHLEAQLRQAQKMEAIGQLAGGVAHDFNNLLCVIQGYTDIVRRRKDVSERVREDLNQIAAASERATGLTRQLLTFSRRQAIEAKALDLNDIVTRVSTMLRRVLGEHITLATNLLPQLPKVQADAGMMEQVLLNFTVNARDAMAKGGRIVVTTQTRTVSRAEAARQVDVVAGPFVCLEFADSGCGISAENLRQIFDPFFTTKGVDQGTGLGLATVHSIVQQHHGWIEVDSESGRGTTFRVFLPAISALPEDAKMHEPQPLRGGSETILLVEDEAPVRDFVSRVLQQRGYEVLATGTGGEALGVWEQRHREIDLLLTDMVMPEGMSGPDLARRLQTEQSGLKVIYTSGYSTEFIGRHVNLEPGFNFLQKPFLPQELVRAVRDHLDA